MDQDRWAALQAGQRDDKTDAQRRGLAYAEIRGYTDALEDQLLANLRSFGNWEARVRHAITVRLGDLSERDRRYALHSFQDFFNRFGETEEDC